jgi:hypothetical protein
LILDAEPEGEMQKFACVVLPCRLTSSRVKSDGQSSVWYYLTELWAMLAVGVAVGGKEANELAEEPEDELLACMVELAGVKAKGGVRMRNNMGAKNAVNLNGNMRIRTIR